MLGEQFGAEDLDLEIGIQREAAKGEALRMLGAAEELIEGAEDGFEIPAHGDPDVVANNGIFIDAADESSGADFTEELDLHDELRLDIDDGLFLAAERSDETDQRAIVDGDGDVGAKLADAVGAFVVLEVQVRGGDEYINATTAHPNDVADF